jgi:hypothetical protein
MSPGKALGVNVSNALALAFAASLVCSVNSAAAQRLLHSHPERHHPRLHQRSTAAHQGSATQTLTQEAPPVERSSPRPLITNDSDGLSRAPEDCNTGCLDSSE